MTPEAAKIIALALLGIILVIPVLCFILYKYKKVRVCLILSHLWCVIVFFLGGMIVSLTLRHHFQRPQKICEAGELIRICKTLRSGDTDGALDQLDNHLAQRLFRATHGIPRDKMDEQDRDRLWVLQEIKEYFDTHRLRDPFQGSMISRIRHQLQFVPLSEMQLAITKFKQTYQSGQPAKAPAINMKSWIGQTVSDDELKSKVILLDFWNIHCGPCVKSMPDLQKLYEKYKDQGLLVIGCAGGNQQKTQEFLAANGYSYPGGMRSKQMYLDYAIRGEPSYFLIDRDGYLVWGPEHRLPTDEEIMALIEPK